VAEITAAGATLIAISPQLEEHGRKAVEQNRLTFDLLTDRGNQLGRSFGLVFKLPDDLRGLYAKFGVDLEKFNGDDSWTLPMPARFVIDSHTIIRSADVNPDYTVRPEPSATIEVLKALKA
jgi:peroxiredoxin